MQIQINPESRTIAEKPCAFILLDGTLGEHNFHELGSAVDPFIESHHAYLVFDLGALEFLSSRLISYLAAMHEKITGREKKMAFVNANEEILNILETVGLAGTVPTFDHETELTAALQRGEF